MVRRGTYDRTIQSTNHFTNLKVILTTMPQNEIHILLVPVFVRWGYISSGYVKCRRPTKGKLKLEDQKGGAHVSRFAKLPRFDPFVSVGSANIDN